MGSKSTANRTSYMRMAYLLVMYCWEHRHDPKFSFRFDIPRLKALIPELCRNACTPLTEDDMAPSPSGKIPWHANLANMKNKKDVSKYVNPVALGIFKAFDGIGGGLIYIDFDPTDPKFERFIEAGKQSPYKDAETMKALVPTTKRKSKLSKPTVTEVGKAMQWITEYLGHRKVKLRIYLDDAYAAGIEIKVLVEAEHKVDVVRYGGFISLRHRHQKNYTSTPNIMRPELVNEDFTKLNKDEISTVQDVIGAIEQLGLTRRIFDYMTARGYDDPEDAWVQLRSCFF